jgi:hypothetical protein
VRPGRTKDYAALSETYTEQNHRNHGFHGPASMCLRPQKETTLFPVMFAVADDLALVIDSGRLAQYPFLYPEGVALVIGNIQLHLPRDAHSSRSSFATDPQNGG